MSIQNETGRARNAADLGNLATLENTDCTQRVEFSQAENNSASGQFAHEPFPSLFELVAQNASASMRRAAAYLRICAEFIDLGDCAGFCEAGDHFLDAGRDFAKLHALLKIPKVFSHEIADRLEAKAGALHEQADLMEMKASRVRSAATL